jgi:hypothetical protein
VCVLQSSTVPWIDTYSWCWKVFYRRKESWFLFAWVYRIPCCYCHPELTNNSRAVMSKSRVVLS